MRVRVTAGKIPALEDMVSLRLKEHMVITVEPSQERTVSPSLLALNEVQVGLDILTNIQ